MNKLRRVLQTASTWPFCGAIPDKAEQTSGSCLFPRGRNRFLSSKMNSTRVFQRFPLTDAGWHILPANQEDSRSTSRPSRVLRANGRFQAPVARFRDGAQTVRKYSTWEPTIESGLRRSRPV